MTTVDWFALPGPAWYRPKAAARAEADLAASTTQDGAALAVGRLFGAVCNDSAGALCPATVPAVRIMLGVIRDRPAAPRIEALDTLLDWWGCFQPDPEYADYEGVDLIPAIQREIRDAAGMLRALADDWTDGGPARKKAKDLLALLSKDDW